jgi:hypothetical protein
MKKLLPIIISTLLFLFIAPCPSFAQLVTKAPTPIPTQAKIPLGSPHTQSHTAPPSATQTNAQTPALVTDVPRAPLEVVPTATPKPTVPPLRVEPTLQPVHSVLGDSAPQGAATVGESSPSDSEWVQDSDVTFTGKMGARASSFLNWTLSNYNWVKLADGQANPLAAFWLRIQIIVFELLGLLVLVGAFILIVTRGRSITITKFIPRFIMMVILIVLSYSILQILYQITDVIQGFFLRGTDGNIISANDIVSIGFDYNSFVGYRRVGANFDESALLTLLMVKLTSVTFYVLSGVLLVRKIILWFFIIISPLFPLLLLYAPIRNTGKLWIGAFFRWLLYAPLFAVLLAGMVSLWKTLIPLPFSSSTQNGFPTAVNILLGGPGQTVTVGNSLNSPDTFAQYVIALLMLWVVILMPFILLKIFLDYMFTIQISDNTVIKQLVESRFSPFAKAPLASTPGLPPSTPPPAGAGLAKQLPFTKRTFNEERIRNQLNKTTSQDISSSRWSSYENSRSNQSSTLSTTNIRATNIKAVQEVTPLLRLSNLSIPTMRDVAKYETAMLSSDTTKHQEVTRVKESLAHIANPTTIASPVERERVETVKKQLVEEGQKGNAVAKAVLTAATTATGAVSKDANAQQQTGQPASLPAVNRVQSVSLDDYESIKKMWQENYQNLDVPQSVGVSSTDRKEWVKKDLTTIQQAIDLLSSNDLAKVKQGMDTVSTILPFLLIGGFSQTEVIAYLKAKEAAAKEVLEDLDKKQEDEDTTVERGEKKAEGKAEMHAEMELPEPAEVKSVDTNKNG